MSTDKVKNNSESLQRGITCYLQQNQNQTDVIRLFTLNKEHSKTMGEILSKGKNKTFEDIPYLKMSYSVPSRHAKLSHGCILAK